ncbi:MATE family efflux transporter [Clostridium sediminicola]
MEIAAITFVGPINNLVRAISDGLAVGGTSLIAREIGRADYRKAKSVTIQLLTIAGFLGIIIACISFIFSKEILIAASATDSILKSANIYFKLTVLSAPLIFINSAYLAIKRANGDTVKVLIVNLVAMAVKILLTYIMIFHLGMGIKSLALSTIVGNVILTSYGFFDLFLRKTIMTLSMKFFRFDKKVILALLLIGVPIIIERSSVSFSFIILNKYVISYGEKVLAGYGITNRINSLFFNIVTGFGTGLVPIISQNLGANQAERAREGVKKVFFIVIMVSIVIISIVLPVRHKVAALFANGDEDVIYHTMNAMGVYSISVIPWAIFQVVSGVFQGTGDTKFNLVISVTRIYCFRLPLVILLSHLSKFEEFSIWYGMLFSNILTGLFALILYLKNHTKLKLVGE